MLTLFNQELVPHIKKCDIFYIINFHIILFRAMYGEIHLQIPVPTVKHLISDALGNKIVDHSDVVGASPAGAAPTTSSFST